ncbi:hypothetical protein KOI35_34220 [Actinoplanes bogorensis]|uniref:Ribosomally synthesized peptide with SipW-like signal peptide n=1 Tax=Paractinoplanes bogorensis TaxID=1610840 RepID=A0ABS5YZ39_9ACTN|nr:hypothetical protein [Actinoplanes bogorensis]MBU2668581.1 hypothetical protein [Actinoplanes bogorensis]
MRKSTKRAAVIVATLAVTGAASAAWASWLANGEGNAYAQADTAKELVITEAMTDATLYPGATGDSTIKIENPNKYPVEVTKVVWNQSDGAQAVSVQPGSHCNNTGIYFGDFSQNTIGSGGVLSGLSLKLAAGETKTFTLSKSIRMINNVEDGCQGAKFAIKVKVTGASDAS